MALLAHVVEKAPAVAGLPQAGLVQKHSEFYALQFGDGVRGCRLSYYGNNELPDAVFSWDRCALFDYQPDDLNVLAGLVSRWICDAAMPSAIREEYPWLEIGDIADAYEQGRGVEGEFVASWDRIQEFFAGLPCGVIPRISPFLAAMRSHGFDRTLRAGQSMATLVLSRSRRHGLDASAPYLTFDFSDAGVTAELSGVGKDRQATIPDPAGVGRPAEKPKKETGRCSRTDPVGCRKRGLKKLVKIANEPDAIARVLAEVGLGPRPPPRPGPTPQGQLELEFAG